MSTDTHEVELMLAVMSPVDVVIIASVVATLTTLTTVVLLSGCCG